MTEPHPLESLPHTALLDMGIAEVIIAWPMAIAIFLALSTDIGHLIVDLNKLPTTDEKAKLDVVQRLMAMHWLLDRTHAPFQADTAVSAHVH